MQSQAEVRAPIYVRPATARPGFRSGLPGRRAQDAQAMQANARLRAPIFDLRASNRQVARDPQPIDIARASKASTTEASKPETSQPKASKQAASNQAFALPAGFGVLVPAGPGGEASLRRLSVNDAYLSAETLDASYAHRGSFFDLQI
ncbi:MAG: hypothetical protein ACTSUD_02370 [Alphaproteobacteria bacterium]